MRTKKLSRFITLLATFGLVFCSFQASPEDIDIFSVDENANVNNPNVLFILDNSANWSQAAQQWVPMGTAQGESELLAIKTVVSELGSNVNVGFMEYVSEGTSNEAASGYIRSHIRPMNPTNKASLTTLLQGVLDDFISPLEKRDSNNPYGTLFWDVYNYLGGFTASQKGAGTGSRADPAAYDSQYDDFRSPLTDNDTCARTIVIFIVNNNQGVMTVDSAENVAALKAAAGGGTDGDAAVAQIPFADYVVKTTPTTSNIARSEVCYSSATACTTAENDADCLAEGFISCSCNDLDFINCPSTHWEVVGSNTESKTTTDSDDDPGVSTDDQYTGETTFCRTTVPPGSCDLPPGTTTQVFANTPSAGQTTTTYTSWTGACSYVDTTINCGAGGKTTWEPHGTKVVRTKIETTTSVTTTAALGDTTACYNDTATCDPTDVSGGCPAATYNAGCECTTPGGTTGCAAGNTKKFMVQGNYNVTAATQTGTFSAAPDGPFMLDEWARFLRQTGVTIPGSTVKAKVTTYTVDVFKDLQNPDISALLFNAARVGGGKYFQAKDQNTLVNVLRQILTEVQAVNSAFSSASLPVNATNRAQNENQVFIGVFKPNREKFPVWFGNLKRYQLISSGATIDLGDVNGNPAINNQTGFITDCAVSGNPDEPGTSWTTDSGPFWKFMGTDDPDALGICASNTTSDWSDMPDGPFVEKGAVAEVLRRGNGDPTQDANRNYSVNRNMYTVDDPLTPTSLVAFDATSSGLDGDTVNFIRGQDVDAVDFNGDGTTSPVVTTKTRSTIHGDVVHSRPQPINHSGTGVVIYYGSNDGTFRAVRARDGRELWSFVAPEHFSKFSRLRKNDPKILFFNDDISTGAQPKDYFFDGSTGVFQNKDNSDIWIFPTMRRGGRTVYGFNVTDPTTPKFLWSKGCPNLVGDADCDTGFEAIGQTWGVPNVALIKGYCGSTACADDTTPRKPVVVLSGGYDACDDENNWKPTCSDPPKGAGVYVIDAETGDLVRYFDFSKLTGVTARSVSADVALIDIDSDSMVDYGYAVDMGGNVYRFDFIDGPTTKVAYDDPTKWVQSRVALTNGDGRKFLFPPALVQITATKIYLAVGTGDREHPLRSHYPYEDRNQDTDLTDGGVKNRFYVFKDNLEDVDEGTQVDLDIACADPLVAGCMRDYTSPTNCSSDPTLPNDLEQGWFIELGAAGKGEQVVTSAVVAAGFVFFSTNRPTETSTTVCTTSLGEARGYFVNLLNGSGAIGVSGACGGTRSSIFVGGGLPPSPVLATVPIGDEIRTVVIGAVQKTGEPSSPIEAQRVRPPIASDRKPIYWYKSTGDK